ncbi:hypothetical protein [Staphylococcus gallinarum]|uniref:hypothetical protein n=1 Tax=Staphylococcus gallinarum TaxID=1293 RepID=UPI001E3985EA|nr:hypothetical protein [Staphylococcus gallinarum]MCD8785702.1 hypothetical protein [Staphylococcus gallinarum]MCD8829005.1 hypothetical protein [Staphylococcus gallinarum]MCD8858412.1 hypothetical protein [Staphylococcus gallinarum]MEB6055756.1 hypothetical protein [Staphylococcus gallinarum]
MHSLKFFLLIFIIFFVLSSISDVLFLGGFEFMNVLLNTSIFAVIMTGFQYFAKNLSKDKSH